jgi:holin-like protein
MKLLRLVGQGFLLWIIFWLGNKIALVSGLPIPGNVFGMLLLYFFLMCGVIQLRFIQDAADFLLRHMLFFFIPIAVGLMNWGTVFYDYGVVLVLALVVGAVLPFFIVGTLVKLIYRGEKRCSR